MSTQHRIPSSISLLLASAALPLAAAFSACILEGCGSTGTIQPYGEGGAGPDGGGGAGPDGGGGAAPVEAVAGCTGRRWIGKFPDGDCPDPPQDSDWTSQKLFQSDIQTPAFLAGYCVYEYAHEGEPDAAEIAALKDAVAARSDCTFAEDCVTVGALGNLPEIDAARLILHDEFIEQVNGPALPPVSAGATLATAQVAVIDTRAGGRSPADPHGTVVGGLIRDLTCLNPQARCAADVTYDLGLPHLNNSDLSDSGGHFGSMSQVATAIYRSVTAWQRRNYEAPNAAPTTPRLVINASLGGQPGADCGPQVDTLSCSAQSAFDAIRHAACQGAIVVVAAGNSPGGPTRLETAKDQAEASPVPVPMNVAKNEASARSGATCPAAWTRMLSRNECEDLEGTSYDARLIEKGFAPFSGSSSEGWLDTPLLVPVAGVDSSDALLPNAREGSLPRSAALGILGTATENRLGTVTGDGTPESFPPPMTGSSLGAASWTATVANVWAYNPELTAREIIDLLHATGSQLYDASRAPRAAVVDWDIAASPDVRRPSVCAAISQLCSSSPRPAACPTSPISCPPLAAVQQQNRDLGALAPTFTALFGDASSTQLFTATRSRSPSPSEEFQTLATPSWVHPQPETQPCGLCGLSLSSSRADIYIDSQFPSDWTVQRATLLVYDNNSNPLDSFDLSTDGMSAGMTRSFLLPSTSTTSAPAQAVISFQVQKINGIGSSMGTTLLMP
ncbi:S8/S53 family peptidase [Sorangium sp. So ce375]|uniref:S8/S53 family peptidase n=1 Tax=Sorangium sp. So ce375 TaxID=3133306 RepID=UPI003F5BF49E